MSATITHTQFIKQNSTTHTNRRIRRADARINFLIDHGYPRDCQKRKTAEARYFHASTEHCRRWRNRLRSFGETAETELPIRLDTSISPNVLYIGENPVAKPFWMRLPLTLTLKASVALVTGKDSARFAMDEWVAYCDVSQRTNRADQFHRWMAWAKEHHVRPAGYLFGSSKIDPQLLRAGRRKRADEALARGEWAYIGDLLESPDIAEKYGIDLSTIDASDIRQRIINVYSREVTERMAAAGKVHWYHHPGPAWAIIFPDIAAKYRKPPEQNP